MSDELRPAPQINFARPTAVGQPSIEEVLARIESAADRMEAAAERQEQAASDIKDQAREINETAAPLLERLSQESGKKDAGATR